MYKTCPRINLAYPGHPVNIRAACIFHNLSKSRITEKSDSEVLDTKINNITDIKIIIVLKAKKRKGFVKLTDADIL
jgi:hypothetical protein